MKTLEQRHEFASDNTAPICAEVLAAVEEVSVGNAGSYGEDQWTARLRARICEIFETDCETFLVFNGTAANALALAQLCQPFHSIVCHKNAHINTDECGAPEFFSGGAKLVLIGGDRGKIDIGEAEAAITARSDVHTHNPRAITITQATELGAVYSRDEIAAVVDLARRRNLLMHMDGARFANAVASLNCAPKEISWQAGIDVLCFGGTKNGLGAGELVIFFKRELAHEFDYRIKQAGQLASKMRFLAAPWLALLNDDLWLRNAKQANASARKLAERLRAECKIDIVLPVEANAVFVRLPNEYAERLSESGWQFYKFLEPDVYRLMCSWATTDSLIDEFVSVLKTAVN